MSTPIYPRLAVTNIRNNSKTYFPYILTCIFTVAMYYIIKSLSMNSELNGKVGGGTARTILTFGSYVIAVFAFIFLFYTNSFLTKNRKKEFGLFNILGMEKRHISRVMGFESLYVTVISLTAGLGFGIFLDKLMFVVVSRLIHIEIKMGFHISPDAVRSTIIIFLILFTLIFLNSLRLIHTAKPIELLHGGQVGEREPKAKLLLAFLGLICLGAGYAISLSVKNPLTAMVLFFVAVILVIIGTYLLFTAVSITFLKILKRNKRYYYKTSHFISVSGMMYRMKQNAVGLANICVLSTMVLVMVSSTTSLIVGLNEVIEKSHPAQFQIHKYDCDDEEYFNMISVVDEYAKKKGVKQTNRVMFSKLEFMAINEKDSLRCGLFEDEFKNIDNTYSLYAVTADDYASVMGDEVTLNDDEVMIWVTKGDYDYDHLCLFDDTYKIVGRVDGFYENYQQVLTEFVPTFGIVFKDMDVLRKINQLQIDTYGPNASSLVRMYFYDTDLPESEQPQFFRELIKDPDFDIGGFGYNNKAESKMDTYGLYGSLFFLGIFLGLLFTVATVLIIYYKQISEGIEDKGRFEIMQKVGMTEAEVRSSIRSQVLTVFFMPLITAGVHTAFAFPMVKKLLVMFQLANVKLFLMCNIGTFLVFALIYGIIYFITSRVYYRIIK